MRGKKPHLWHMAVVGWLVFPRGCWRLRPPVPVAKDVVAGLLGVRVSAASVVEVCAGRPVAAMHASYRGVKLELRPAEHIDAPTGGYPLRLIAESEVDASALLLFADPLHLPSATARVLAAHADVRETLHVLPSAHIFIDAGIAQLPRVENFALAAKLQNPAVIRATVRAMMGVATAHDWDVLAKYRLADAESRTLSKVAYVLIAAVCHHYEPQCREFLRAYS